MIDCLFVRHEVTLFLALLQPPENTVEMGERMEISDSFPFPFVETTFRASV